MSINLLATLTAALSVFVIGGIWYSPMAFGKIWAKAAGYTMEDKKKGGHKPMVFVYAFIFSLVAAFIFSLYLGAKPNFFYAVSTGFKIGLFFVATSFGINYMFANRSFKMLLIDGGYHTAQFTVYGLILGLWH